MITLPTRKDEGFQLDLLQAIAGCPGGIGIAEEIRPAIERARKLKVPRTQHGNWHTTVSFALIDMAEPPLGKGWLSRPFSTLGQKRYTKKEVAWIRENRPTFKPQRVWQITKAGRARLNREKVASAEQLRLLTTDEETRPDRELQKTDEAREKILGLIAVRRGQPRFRRELIDIYRRCMVSNCDAEAALEAAHIRPYALGGINHPSNGLLLRADLHTLFDLQLLSINPETATVCLASALIGTVYQEFQGRRLPKQSERLLDRQALNEHFAGYKKHS